MAKQLERNFPMKFRSFGTEHIRYAAKSIFEIYSEFIPEWPTIVYSGEDKKQEDEYISDIDIVEDLEHYQDDRRDKFLEVIQCLRDLSKKIEEDVMKHMNIHFLERLKRKLKANNINLSEFGENQRSLSKEKITFYRNDFIKDLEEGIPDYSGEQPSLNELKKIRRSIQKYSI